MSVNAQQRANSCSENPIFEKKLTLNSGIKIPNLFVHKQSEIKRILIYKDEK